MSRYNHGRERERVVMGQAFLTTLALADAAAWAQLRNVFYAAPSPVCSRVSQANHRKRVVVFAAVSRSRPGQGKVSGKSCLAPEELVHLRVVPDGSKGAPGGRAGRRRKGINQVGCANVPTPSRRASSPRVEIFFSGKERGGIAESPLPPALGLLAGGRLLRRRHCWTLRDVIGGRYLSRDIDSL